MWKDTLLTRISNLLSVKTIITTILSIVFAILALRGELEAKDVMAVFLMVVSFYFGTQQAKQENKEE